MKKYVLLFSLCLGCICTFFYVQTFKMRVNASEGPTLTAHFFSVGQGDVSLLHTPGNKWILVDGGPEEDSATEALNPILSPFTGKIDMIILSHPHKDHIAGLLKILDIYEVGSILMYPIDSNELQEQFIKKSKEKGIPIIEANPQQDIQLDEATYIDILAPTFEVEREEKNINNLSLVFMIKSGKHTILYTGDAELEEEHQLLLSKSYLDADIMKGGHHGSKTSSSVSFLSAVSPELVIYMNGIGNSFGHPDPETLAVLEEKKIPYFNTSLDGTITVTCMLIEEKCSRKKSN